jgi:pyruvate dehydrogenase E2 component (dihydrolipoamide acetyltransferase)
MATAVVMPRLSDTMEEGSIARWLKKEGEAVESGDIIAEIETDKALMEMEAYASGVLRKIIVGEGITVPLGETIAIIGQEGEDISALLGGKAAPAAAPSQPKPAAPPAEKPPAKATKEEALSPTSKVVAMKPSGKLRSSPLARNIAEQKGIDLSEVQGSGPRGRIIKRDVEGYEAKVPSRPAPVAGPPMAEYERVPLTSMRKVIAHRLVESKAPVPHFYITSQIDMGPAMELRASLNALEEGFKISFNDMIVRASALALKRVPQVNSSFQGNEIRVYNHVHIGIAVSLDDGLITPVIRNCETKSLVQISKEAKELSERARARKLKPDEYTGATFTVSNMGMMDVENFAAIINPPEGAILAVGSITKMPVVVDDQIKIGHRMKVTISCDHRVIDGATGAKFLMELKRVLEKPLNLLAG